METDICDWELYYISAFRVTLGFIFPFYFFQKSECNMIPVPKIRILGINSARQVSKRILFVEYHIRFDGIQEWTWRILLFYCIVLISKTLSRWQVSKSLLLKKEKESLYPSL